MNFPISIGPSRAALKIFVFDEIWGHIQCFGGSLQVVKEISLCEKVLISVLHSEQHFAEALIPDSIV